MFKGLERITDVIFSQDEFQMKACAEISAVTSTNDDITARINTRCAYGDSVT